MGPRRSKPCPCLECDGTLRQPQTIVKHLQAEASRRAVSTFQSQLASGSSESQQVAGGELPRSTHLKRKRTDEAISDSPLDSQSPIPLTFGSEDEDDNAGVIFDESESEHGPPPRDNFDILEHPSFELGDGDTIPSESEAHLDTEDDYLLYSDDEVDLRTREDRSASRPDVDADQDNNQELDLTHDPLFQTREAMFDEEREEVVITETSRPAFDEPPFIRNVYIRAFILSAYKNATHDTIRDFLLSHKRSFLAMQEDGLLSLDIDLSEMATTLPTVERRLGVAPDEHITYYFICPSCWDRHKPSELKDLDSPLCKQVKNGSPCNGVLYSVSSLASGTRGRQKEKRTPTKILPYSSLEGYIRRMLLRPGKAEELEHWRKDDVDQPVACPPFTIEEWEDTRDETEPMYDVHDAAAWRSAQAGLHRLFDSEGRIARDSDVQRLNLRFVSLPLALMFTLNIDWFQPMKLRLHSTGAIYININNLPRHLRFLRENTFLSCVLPGPSEPSKEELNIVLELIVKEILTLANGIRMDTLRPVDRDEDASPAPRETMIKEELVYGQLFMNCSDTPARAKASGHLACTSEDFMCPACTTKLSSLVHPDCFNPEKFVLRDEGDQLFWKLVAKTASDNRRDQIAEHKGVRSSAFDDLPGWFSYACSPVDPMHCIILGCMSHIHRAILFNGGMFNSSRKKGDINPADAFQDFISGIWWPSWVNKGNGKIKADQWRNLMAVYAIALFVAWREGDEIKPGDAPKATQKSKVATAQDHSLKTTKQRRVKKLAADFGEDDIDEDDLEDAENTQASRNYSKHYEAVLNFLAGSRILLTQSISIHEADRFEAYYSRSFQSWARMGCHLTPNFHLAMHMRVYIRLYGPVPGWWVFAQERMNGVLGRINTNGHTGGELEATLMRGWIKNHLLQDLVSQLQSIERKSADDEGTIQDLLQAMKGGNAEGHQARGTLQSYIQSITPRLSQDGIVLPKQGQDIDLINGGLYGDVLSFVRACRPGEHIVSSGERTNTRLASTRVYANAKSYSTVLVNGLKYGSFNHHRGKKSCYAFINGRQAVRIERVITVALSEGEVHCCQIRKFRRPLISTPPPWFDFAVDLGIDMWEESSDLDPPKLILLSELVGHFAWKEIPYNGQVVVVTCSLDHTGQEPDVLGRADD